MCSFLYGRRVKNLVTLSLKVFPTSLYKKISQISTGRSLLIDDKILSARKEIFCSVKYSYCTGGVFEYNETMCLKLYFQPSQHTFAVQMNN